MAERPVLVCTQWRGVFFGYSEGDLGAEAIRLRRCRMAVYWSADVRGVLGLAVSGPTAGCRISLAPDGVVRGVTAAFECSPEAARAWEAAPWSE